ncbi:hypothetical protein OBA40_02425 [Alphaproteobacteria bacterium]|nr:hypothetical protein [Alphaproteobacteria bacterium]
MFKRVLNFFLSCGLIFLLNIAEIEVYSQTTNSTNKELLDNNKNSIIKVSKLEKPSLGSLGIKTDINEIMGLDIWNKMKATDIIENFNYIPDILLSKSLHIFLSDLYLSTSNPPIGNSDNIVKFLETRLYKIKSGGESKKLYQLVTQLPGGKRWDFWKRWQIEYELINRQDKKACQYVNKKSKINSDNFWQMARIFCLAIEGKVNQSEFILDLIKSRGFSDKIFENLFQIINNNEKTFNLENEYNKIQPLHVIMMDTLKIPIKANYIAHFAVEYTDSLLSLTYLTPSARSFLLDKKMNYSFVNVNEIIDNYKSVADGNIDIKKALSSYTKKPNGLSRANVWLAIITMKDEIKKAESIITFIKLEIRNGRFKDIADLYIPVLEKIDKSSLTKELNNSINRLMIIYKPNLHPDSSLANIIMLEKDKIWNWEIILKERAWPIIPIIEKSGMKEPSSIEWLDYVDSTDEKKLDDNSFIRWENSNSLKNFILRKSIEQAADNDRKALTVLLIGRLMDDTTLVDFDINNMITIRSALIKIGFLDLADKITYEIMTSKFINF